MKPSISLSSGPQRGIALMLVLFIVVMLLLVAVAVLSNSSFSANDSLSVQTKNQTFDAAEAGLQLAQWNLDQSLGAPDGDGGTNYVNGYKYHWEIVSNQLSGVGNPSVTDPDPAQPNIPVPSGQALLAGWASSITGGRTVYVEEMVALAPPTYLAPGAITCGKTGTISHQQITDTSGHHSADIRCGILVASGGGQTPDGNSYASGASNAIVGYDGMAHVNQTPPVFLTAAQLAAIQGSALSKASSGAPNYYTAGNLGSGTIGSSGTNCVAYIGGNITLNGASSLINYCPTTVVMGNVNIGGTADYQALPASVTHIVYVFGTGGAVLHGTPTTVGIFYVANGDVTINGGGHGDFTGALITPNNVTMHGGGSAHFDYNGTQTPPPIVNQFVVPQSQWEY